MSYARHCLAAATILVAAASDAAAQGLAQRVSAAPDGLVQFSFAAREGCAATGGRTCPRRPGR